MFPRWSAAIAIAVAVAVVALALAPVPASAERPPSAGASSVGAGARGHVLLIGGNLDEDATILRRLVDLADPDGSGPRRARIAVVTAAATPARTPAEAGDPVQNNAAANGLYYADLLARFGVDTYRVPLDGAINYPGDPYTPAAANDKAVAKEVGRSTGVFFGGGDQMRYVRTLMSCADAPDEAFVDCEDSAVLKQVRKVLQRGGVVSGVSAGTTIQQGPNMVTGGESYEGWRDGAQPGYLDDPAQLGYPPAGGFGFFEEGLLDSHFTTWGRQARMVRLADEVAADRVVGVDETTALDYDRRSRTAEVIGRHGVSVLDLAEASVDGESAQDVRWSHLISGDVVDFRTGDITPRTAATTAPGTGAPPAQAADVWDSIDGDGGVYSLRDLARDLVASSATRARGTTFEQDPAYRTTLVRDARTQWWTGDTGIGFEDLELQVDRP